jgi:lipopolysaccharide/colanic/teichoic acid biosynthesis glycosyltransferase
MASLRFPPRARQAKVSVEKSLKSPCIYFAVKRGLDFSMSVAAIILLFPVFALVAVCIFLEDPGPVIFTQERIGLRGAPFRIYKFRSMRFMAEREFESLSEKAGHEVNRVQFKLKSDPRVTKVGRVIRKYSLDELPQILNVLFGQMSLVGPRPHVQKEVDRYPELAELRHSVRPGLTGLWQVSGRSLLTWEESISLDIFYAKNASLILDLRVVVRTVPAVISARGAY